MNKVVFLMLCCAAVRENYGLGGNTSKHEAMKYEQPNNNISSVRANLPRKTINQHAYTSALRWSKFNFGAAAG
jgi:hypothetical protein